jgi:predicted GNAT family N-acyltransferase
MIIRQITADELPLLYALRHEVLRKPLGLDLYDQDFSVETNWYKIGAFIDAQLVACVMLTVLPNDIVKVRQMAVDNSFQGKGIGMALMSYVHQWCVQHDYFTTELHARKSAIGFYQKLDYAIIGDEFLEVNIPHVAMQKRLVE